MAEAPKVADIVAPVVTTTICRIIDYAVAGMLRQDTQAAEAQLGDAIRTLIKVVDSVKS
jgi:hypothetical protein